MNDSISMEQAIKELAEAYEDIDDEWIIRKTPAGQQRIPVSERLPKDGQHVIAQTKIGITAGMRFFDQDADLFVPDIFLDRIQPSGLYQFKEGAVYFTPKGVSAWMPLRESYKDKKG